MLLSACATLESDIRIGVKQDAKTCELTQTKFTAGVATFVIENVGDATAEFYILKEDAKSVVAEIENIGAGLTRELTAQFNEGIYVYSCEQMAGGEEIRGKLTVTAANKVAEQDSETTAAVSAYKQYVIEQGDSLLAATEGFTKAVKAKDVAGAKKTYPVARSYWERIEPVAESFGDLDPKMDAREGDLEEGATWTGWHNLEKQLWVTGLQADAPVLADQLLADTKDLVQRIATVELNLAQIANGAKELMDEVATGKVTGEEERYSHTDLWDFSANVEGAQMVVTVSRVILEKKDAALLATLDEKFDALNIALAKLKAGDGFKLYTGLNETEIKHLAALVEAVSEPLSKLTSALVK
jgi:iron uptake system component EfeO